MVVPLSIRDGDVDVTMLKDALINGIVETDVCVKERKKER